MQWATETPHLRPYRTTRPNRRNRSLSDGSLPFGFNSDPSVHHSVTPGSDGSLPFGFNSDPSVHHSVTPGSDGSLPFGFNSDPSVHHSVTPGSDGSLPFGFNSDPSVHHSVAPGSDGSLPGLMGYSRRSSNMQSPNERNRYPVVRASA
jgi:hypothetical protein